MRTTCCTLAGALLAGSFLLPSAHAELVYQGARRDHEAKIRAIFAKLPPRGKEINASVAEMTSAEWTKVMPADDPDSVGVYDDQTHEIWVKSDEEEVDVTFAHEFGHHVYYASLSRGEKRDWKQFWKSHRKEMPGEEYQEDPTEAFAECYAHVYMEGSEPLSPAVTDKIRTFFTERTRVTRR